MTDLGLWPRRPAHQRRLAWRMCAAVQAGDATSGETGPAPGMNGVLHLGQQGAQA